MVDSSDLMESAMRIKSPEEIAVLRRSAALSSAGMKAAIDQIRVGASDNDVAAAAYKTVVALGGEYFSLQPIVTTGRRSGIPHSTFRRNRLAEGHVVFVEIAASFERYSAPLLRTAILGPPSAEVQRTFDAAMASVSALVANIRPGAIASDVARKAGNALQAIKPDLIWHGFYGYSVGLAFPPMCCDCQSTEITEQSSMELEPGMVFHCSTSLRDLGNYGTTIGESVLVTEDGCEVLTDAPRELAIR
jgi:Xaa-Pro aminopeptidase